MSNQNVMNSNNHLRLFIPQSLADEWIQTEKVGFSENLIINKDCALFVLVEKDFQCLEPSWRNPLCCWTISSAKLIIPQRVAHFRCLNRVYKLGGVPNFSGGGVRGNVPGNIVHPDGCNYQAWSGNTYDPCDGYYPLFTDIGYTSGYGYFYGVIWKQSYFEA